MKELYFLIIGSLAVFCSSTNGETWTPMDTPDVRTLNDVWGSAPDDVYAVGYDGVILHYDGNPDNICEQMTSPTGNHLFGIFGSGPDDIYAVGGYQPTMIHYNGIEWSLITDDLPSSNLQFFNDVWVNGSHVFAVGQGYGESYIFHFDGNSWSYFSEDSPIPGAGAQLHYVWGRSSNDVYAFGHDGIGYVMGIMYHYDGDTWELYYPGGPKDLPEANSGSVWGPSGSTELFFVGGTHRSYGPMRGQIVFYNGINWEEPHIFSHSVMLDTIWGTAYDDIYVAARAGKILHFDGIAWYDMETGVNGYYGGLWGDQTCMYAAGGDINTERALILYLQADNTSPVADAGVDQIVEQESYDGSYVTLDGSGSNDPDNDPLTYSWTWNGESASGISPEIFLPPGTTTVTLVVNDGTEDSEPDTVDITVVDTTPPEISIFAPEQYGLYPAGSLILDFEAIDSGSGVFDCWGELSDSTGYYEEVEPGFAPATGVYTLDITAIDEVENSAHETVFFVVYDPTDGFVTGGGWIWSEPGAYAPDPTLEGKANFGFVSKYKKGANVPTGNTEFVFQTGDLNFHSSSYDWLVVTGSDYARFKGWGSINGEGDYRFMLWAGDGPDTFRIKIWWEDGEIENIVYDNGMNQPIEGGSIIVHTK